MSGVSVGRFETKRGECRIDGEAVIIDESIRQHASNLYRGYWQSNRRWHRSIFLSSILALPMGITVLGLLAVSEGVQFILPYLAGFAAVFVAIRVIQRYGRKFTSRSTIPLRAIDSVTLIDGTPPFTRPRFILTYSIDGRRRRRYVTMPSLSMPHGETSLDRAVKCFEEAGFTVYRSD